MYKCGDCEREFLTPKKTLIKEIHDEVPPPHVETLVEYHCPYCDSDFLKDGQLCECCDERWTDDEFCKPCIEKVETQVETFQHSHNLGYKTAKEVFLAWAELNW